MRFVLISGFQGSFLRRCSSFLRSFSSSLGFTLAATHFTWVVRRAAVWQHYSGGFDHRRCFDRCRLYRNWSRLNDHFRLGFNNRSRCFDSRCLFDEGRGLFDFTGFDRCRFHWGFGSHCRFGRRGFFHDRLWRNFNHRFGGRFHHYGFADRLFDHRSNGDVLGLCNGFDLLGGLGDFAGVGFGDFGGSALGLLVGLSFGIGTDAAAGNSRGHGQAGSQFGTQLAGLVLLWLLFAAVVFAAFDQLTVGIALTLATVAATTLAAGTAARTLAIGAFLLVLQQFFVRQLLFGKLCSLLGGFFAGTWLALFTWWAWGTLFTWGTFFTRSTFFTWRALFARGTLFTWCAFFTRCTLFAWGAFFTCYTLFTWLALFTCSGCRRGFQRLAQFAYRAFFAVATTVFARLTWLALFARCTFFTRGTFFTWRAFFARLTLFAWGALGTLFAWLALFIAAAVTVAGLLAAVATLFVARGAFSSWFFGSDGRCGDRFVLAGEQADQRLDQAFEQAWLWGAWRGPGQS